MFDQVKLNQNSIINLLKVPEKENTSITTAKSGNDFFSMVMEKTGLDEKRNITENKPVQNSEPQRKDEKTEQTKSEPYNERAENIRNSEKSNQERNVSETEKNNHAKPVGNENNHEKGNDSNIKDIRKNPENINKEIKGTKNRGKDSEDEPGIINLLHGENNIKNLMEIIKAAATGNKKAEEDNFQKLFSNLKPGNEKEKSQLAATLKKHDTDKSQKPSFEMSNSFIKEIKESLSREIYKSLENRKSMNKTQPLSDRELKELATSIIEGIKKNKVKDTVRHDGKIVSNDELKNDKKPVPANEALVFKKAEISDDSAFEKNSSRDKNHGKDNFSYNGGKIDFSGKSGLDKMEHTLKMTDFRENLQEIIDKAKVSVRDSRNGTFTVKLNPQELGNVNVNLIMENGIITGKFLVDNEDVKSMLLSSLNDLKYQMEEAGIAVGDFSVNVSDQREKYLKPDQDESLKSLVFDNSEKDIMAAADQYFSNSAAHAGHINMVI